MYLVCGEALFDLFLEREDGPGALRFDARAGGSPFNVAIGISRLGGKSGLLTGVSRDMLGERLLGVLEREGVVTDYLLRSGRRTTLSLVGVDGAGQPAYVFYGLGSADCNVNPEELPEIGAEVSGIHFGSYSLVVRPVADALAAVAERYRDRFISVDPNVRPTVEPDIDTWRERVAGYAARAQLIKISTEDMEILYPGVETETQAGQWLDAGVELVVVTDGDREVLAWTRGGVEARIRPAATSVVDTVGAGDTFQAALLARLAELGEPGEIVSRLDRERTTQLLEFAARAAAITCSRRGADLPHRSELEA